MPLAPLVALALAAPTAPAAQLAAPAPGGQGPSPAPVGAYPADEPQPAGHSGLKEIELDVFAGPSYSNTGGAGVGVRTAIYDHQASPHNFGLKWFASAGGGLYALGGSVGTQGEVLATGEIGVGYLGIKALQDGTALQAFLNFLSLNVDSLTHVQGLYSYTPNLQIGILGRSAKTSSNWNVHLHLGGSFSYVTGALEKISPTGGVASWLIDPWAQLSLSTDLHLSSKVFLRLGANIGDTVDFLGGSNGVRQIFETRGHAYFKLGKTIYTGPSVVFDDPQKVAVFVPAPAYVTAPASYTLTWLVGGAINPG
ncbi:MAG: hypothetical protein ACYDCL_06940 [Myxococcales bacterium]